MIFFSALVSFFTRLKGNKIKQKKIKYYNFRKKVSAVSTTIIVPKVLEAE
jgi:hypothetical protein